MAAWHSGRAAQGHRPKAYGTLALPGFRLSAFRWKHRDINLPRALSRALFHGNATQLSWAWSSATRAPFYAPYTGFHVGLPDGTTILNYNEGFNTKMTDAEIADLGRRHRTDILLAGMQLNFVADVVRGVAALKPKVVVLYPPHEHFHAMMGVVSEPWPKFAGRTPRAFPRDRGPYRRAGLQPGGRPTGECCRMIRSSVLSAAFLLLAWACPAAAEVVRLEITSKQPYGTFRPGDYVLWKGRVHGELGAGREDPRPRQGQDDERGKVEYAADLMLLMPADPAKGNGALLVDVPNRGRVYGIALYNGPRGEPFNSGNIQQGTGFLEDRGFSLAEVQWELGKGADLPTFTGPDGKTRYVEGAGFAIFRDTAEFLAHGSVDAAGTPNPLRGAIDRVLASGKSQSGRFLKTYLFNGFNRVDGRRVVDGMHIFVSGAGMLPILTSSTGPKSSGDAAPSFTDPEFRGVNEGPFTIGEIVAAVEKRGEVPPRIVMVSSTTDYLSLRASLGRTGAGGTADQPLPANVRMYDIAGASHVVLPKAPACTLPLARLDWAPVSRATLRGARWLGRPQHGAAGQQADAARADRRMPTCWARPSYLPTAVVQRPKRDSDGNVLGGVRLPDMEAPLGVHAAQQEPKSFSCALAGAFLPFTQAQIAARYKDRDDYVNRIRTAARALQKQGFCCPRTQP